MNGIEQELVRRIEWASKDGCPVVGYSSERWAKMAAIARRRWFSFARRNEHKVENQKNRIEDLACGLCERFESGGLRMAGPLISDYRWLAEQLADVFEAEVRRSDGVDSGPSAKTG